MIGDVTTQVPSHSDFQRHRGNPPCWTTLPSRACEVKVLAMWGIRRPALPAVRESRLDTKTKPPFAQAPYISGTCFVRAPFSLTVVCASTASFFAGSKESRMHLAVVTLVALATVGAIDAREKRQVQYQPSAASQGSTQDQYAQQQQLQGFRQAAPQQQYDSSAFQQPQQQAPRGRTTVQSFGGGLARPQQQQQSSNSQNAEEEEEEEKPNPLTLLLEKSTFTCGGKKDGYYSDNSVQCQVFHYCVGGAKHSWMCPEGTVFHQVHLNCVPASQDICQESEKFFFVNEYLHKELEDRGPNNTVLYAQRYYPDGYVLGDPFTFASGGHSQPQPQPQQQQQHFPPRAPAQPQSPPASVPFRQSQPAQRRPQPAQFQTQQFPAAAPPQYTIQPQPQPGTAFRGAAPASGQSGRNVGGAFSFPPTRTYTIPAPAATPTAARTPEANPPYLYRQAAPSQGQHSSVKYDDDY